MKQFLGRADAVVIFDPQKNPPLSGIFPGLGEGGNRGMPTRS